MSLLFEVLNAITGTREKPATHNMPRDCRTVLTHCANRAGKDRVYRFSLSLLGADGDLGTVTVRKCITDLLAHGWLEDAGWSGPRNFAVRCFRVRTDGTGWPVSTTMHRLSPPQRRALAAEQAAASRGEEPTDPPPSPGASPGHHAAPPRSDANPDLGHSPRVDKPLRDPPIDPLIRSTLIAGSDRTGSETLPLFGAVAASGGESKEPSRKKRDAAEPRAADRYGAAYEKAHADAGFPIVKLSTSERKYLGAIAETHARYRDDTPIVGDELVQWFYRRGRAFRVDKPDPSRHRGGASPYGFRAWLDNGADGEERPLAPGQVEPDPEDDLPEELRTPWEIRGPDPTPEQLAKSRAIIAKYVRPRAAAHG